MTIQTVNLGSAPTGAGGDTFRSTGAKMNENFTNNTHAASRYVGTAAGNVMEVGAFGLGENAVYVTNDTLLSALRKGFIVIGNQPAIVYGQQYGAEYNGILRLPTAEQSEISVSRIGTVIDRTIGQNTDRIIVKTTANTQVDPNGFIKAASPIVSLYADKIELNDEAAEQNITFEKLDVGHYLLKGTSGFAKEGWWIEIPTDTHGNKICAVEYQTLENGDLEIKTFKKKLNDEGDIVANLDAPIDIPNNANGEPRWIDIRLNSIKKTIVRKIPRTEKQPRMVQQVKYAPQLTYITKYEDLFDDAGNPVVVGGKNYQKPVTHIQTDQNGTPILTNQPVINENGEPVFEWVQAFDSEGNPVFDDVPVLDKDGNPIYDEVTYDPE
ncbi:hypothetical protein L2645_17580 [Acinetobacter baumannii]|uniref:phage tail fiber protein n=1 Tax=Acinetobacter baumannii TaxID=470 RepID=UPI002148508A|nr:hypothetical protein [Acinetobacter baumannii]MCR0012706.1 hypothetical protein [Acinetobacter baumannii]